MVIANDSLVRSHKLCEILLEILSDSDGGDVLYFNNPIVDEECGQHHFF